MSLSNCLSESLTSGALTSRLPFCAFSSSFLSCKLPLSCESECRSGCRVRPEAWLLQLHQQLQPKGSCNANPNVRFGGKQQCTMTPRPTCRSSPRTHGGPGMLKYKSAFTVCRSFRNAFSIVLVGRE